ncbi:suppressor APC domain-containing protein 2 [Rhinophrynus dorsalis]
MERGASAGSLGEMSLSAGGEAGCLEGLPRAFVHSLRTLFELLDDGRRGWVPVQEIESRWRGAHELPTGVLSCLREAAGPGGQLTFQRFVHGLRTSMHRAPGESCGGPRNPGHVLQGAPGRTKHGGGVKSMCRSQSEATSEAMTDQCRHQRTRGEQRRHTITNGVDYGLLKKMKELEQEKDFLIQGLEMVERAREWYHLQIQAVQDQQRNLGKSQVDYFCDGKSGDMNQWLPKLQEVNRCLSDLVSSCKAGSSSPGAAPAGHNATLATEGQQQAVNMLKEQNRLLTKEVTDKSERITQLEQEKSALIKQLFEARARHSQETSCMDSTFI